MTSPKITSFYHLMGEIVTYLMDRISDLRDWRMFRAFGIIRRIGFEYGYRICDTHRSASNSHIFKCCPL